MEDSRYIATRLDQAKERERQFQSDIDRLKRESPLNSAAISQKEGYLESVRREIREWEAVAKGSADSYEGQQIKSTRSHLKQDGNLNDSRFRNRAGHLSNENALNAQNSQSSEALSNKGIESMRSKAGSVHSAPTGTGQGSQNIGIANARRSAALNKPNANPAQGRSENPGIKSFESRSNGQTNGSGSSRSSGGVSKER